MTNINKAHFDVDGDNLRLTMPIAKVDEEKRIVSGFATLDNIDRQGDVLLSEASRKAFENFRGNVRLMHQPIPAGKVVSFRENSFYDKETGQTYSGIFVDAYISKGAENIWQMVLDGTLTGFSIGGRILDFENSMDKNDEESTVRVVKEYELMELSLVDSPANQFANIFSIQKLGDEIITSGIATEFTTDTVFWCSSDSIAFSDKVDSMDCPVCKGSMIEIGWVESSDINKNQEIGKVVDNFMAKADSLSVGDFVSWGSSGGTARGKVERISRTGSINVPDSDFTINSEEGNPAVLIRVYRKGANGWERTDRVVGHKMSTLTRISSLGKRMNDEESEGSGKRKGEMHKSRSLVENHPECNGGFGVVNSDGELEGCYTSQAEAQNSIDQYNAQEMQDDEEDHVMKETVTNEVTPNRNAQQGIRGGIPKEKKKKKVTYKADSSPIKESDFVAFKSGSSVEKGRVELLNTEKASVRVYERNKNNKFVQTNNIIVKQISELTKIVVASITKSVPDETFDKLKDLISQHNEKYGNVTHKSVTVNDALEVYSRGIKAFNASPAKGKEEVADLWARERVNGFLNAIAKGKFKRMPYDTDLLPTGHPLSTKKSGEVENSPLTLQKQEGGVEMAENQTSHEELDTAQAIDETSVEEVEFEVEETIEGVVVEALAMAKADGIEVDAADASPEVSDLEKAVGEVKSFVEEALAKSIESSTESLDKITGAVIELSKAVDEKIGQLQSKYEEVTKSLADLNNAATEIATRVESVEEETAMKKSGELESSIPEQPVMKKSLWGGRFLSSAELFN